MKKMKSEYLIVPVLSYIKICNEDFAQLFSGENLPADKKEKLNGEVDFIWVSKPNVAELQKPIISVCKAKKGVIETVLPNVQHKCMEQEYITKRKKIIFLIFMVV
jgi:hypothetical protein